MSLCSLVVIELMNTAVGTLPELLLQKLRSVMNGLNETHKNLISISNEWELEEEGPDR